MVFVQFNPLQLFPRAIQYFGKYREISGWSGNSPNFKKFIFPSKYSKWGVNGSVCSSPLRILKKIRFNLDRPPGTLPWNIGGVYFKCVCICVARVPFLKPLYLRRYSTYRGLPGAKLTYSLWRFQGNLLIGASCSGSIDMSTEPTDPCIYVCSVLMFYIVQLRERSLLFKVRQLHFYVISAHCNVRNYLGEAN